MSLTCFRSFLWLVIFRPCPAQQLAVVFHLQRSAVLRGMVAMARKEEQEGKARERAAVPPEVDCETSGALTPAARFRYFGDRLICEACNQLTDGQMHEAGTECRHPLSC